MGSVFRLLDCSIPSNTTWVYRFDTKHADVQAVSATTNRSGSSSYTETILWQICRIHQTESLQNSQFSQETLVTIISKSTRMLWHKGTFKYLQTQWLGLVPNRNPERGNLSQAPTKLHRTYLKTYNKICHLIQLDATGRKLVVHHNKLKPHEGSKTLKWAKKALIKASTYAKKP